MNRDVAAVIVAAGDSRRMGSPKQKIDLCGKPVLVHTLLAFQQAAVGALVVVTRREDTDWVREQAQRCGIPLTAVVPGGATRQESVKAGLAACEALPLIAIHDGARPLVTADVISRVAAAARQSGAAAAAVRAVDTVKYADEAGVITGTPERSRLWQVQTPQIFDRQRYEAALQGAADYTDDCQVMEHAGVAVQLIESGTANFKVTVPEDVIMARAILQERSDGA